MTFDELIAVLQAAKAGKIIQRPIGNGKYEDATDFVFSVDRAKFRIKPEPRTIWVPESAIPNSTSMVSWADIYSDDDKQTTDVRAKLVKFVEALE